MTLGGLEVDVSDEQLAALKSLAETAEAKTLQQQQELESLPSGFVGMQLDFKMRKIAFDIVETKDADNCGSVGHKKGTKMSLLYASLDDLTAHISRRRSGFLVQASVGNACIQGIALQNDIYFQYVRSERWRLFGRDDDNDGIPDLASNKESPRTSNALLEVTIEQNPAFGVSLAVGCSVSRSIISYNHECVERILDWTQDLKTDLTYAAMLAETARSKAESIASIGVKMGSDFATIYAQPESTVKVTMSLRAPTLFIPSRESGLGRQGVSLLVLKFGLFEIDTLPSENGGDAYQVGLKDTNAYLCSSVDKWETAQNALLKSPASFMLKLDKPTLRSTETKFILSLASIDARITKAHILHAFALQDTMQMFLGSNEEKSRKQKEKQQEQLRRIDFQISKEKIKKKLERIAPNGMEESQSNTESLAMQARVIVQSLSVSFEATAADAESGDVWSRTVSPQKSIELELKDFSVAFVSWNSKTSIIEVQLRSIAVRHYGGEGNRREKSEVFTILSNEKHTESWRNLLKLAAEFENAYRDFDVEGKGSLTLKEVKTVLDKVLSLLALLVQKYKC
jgi:hypothetical protein